MDTVEKTLPKIGYQKPSTVNHQPSTVNHQPSTVNRQPSTVNRQPSTVNRQQKKTGFCTCLCVNQKFKSSSDLEVHFRSLNLLNLFLLEYKHNLCQHGQTHEGD